MPHVSTLLLTQRTG